MSLNLMNPAECTGLNDECRIQQLEVHLAKIGSSVE